MPQSDLPAAFLAASPACPARFQPVGQRARLGQGSAARNFSDLHLVRADRRAVPAGGDRLHHVRSGLARIVVLAGIVVRRLARRAGLSRAQRQKFPRCRAWPVVSVRARSGLEQFRPAVAKFLLASGSLRTENTKTPAAATCRTARSPVPAR